MDTFWNHLRPNLLIFLDPSNRFFYANFILIAVILVLLYFSKADYKKSIKEFLSPHYWKTKQTLEDLGLFLINRLLRSIVFILIPLSAVSISIFIARLLDKIFGSIQAFDVSTMTAFTLFTIMSFIIGDFLRFIFHYAFHKVPMLWKFHQLHHSAKKLTPLTLYRTHPIESIFAFLRGSLSYGISAGIFIYLFQIPVGGIDILGVNAIGFVFNAALSNLRHSPIPISFGIFEYVFISPKQHQIHHSSKPEHFDKNFGTALTIWDLIFGTLINSNEVKEKLEFGSIKRKI